MAKVKIDHRKWNAFRMIDSNKTRRSGFTLIEVVVVLVLLGILAAYAMASMSSDQGTLVAETDRLKSHLRYAQFRALSAGTAAANWSISFSGTSYTLNSPTGTQILPGEDSATHTLPAGMTISGSGVSSPITFDEWGSPSSYGTMTVTYDSYGRTFTITQDTGYIP